MKRGKLGKCWPLTSNVEFESNLDPKSFALSVEPDITSRVASNPEVARYSFFLFNHGLDSTCVTALCVFPNFLTAIAGGSENSKLPGYTSPYDRF